MECVFYCEKNLWLRQRLVTANTQYLLLLLKNAKLSIMFALEFSFPFSLKRTEMLTHEFSFVSLHSSIPLPSVIQLLSNIWYIPFLSFLVSLLYITYQYYSLCVLKCLHDNHIVLLLHNLLFFLHMYLDLVLFTCICIINIYISHIFI